MKRKKTRNESLVRLREIIDMTQREFATRVGMSLDLIKGIESGRNKLSHTAAHRIFASTGVEGASLLRADGRPLYLTGSEEYTKEHFDDWNTRLFPSNEMSAWEQFESIVAPHMLLLMLAATKPSKSGKIQDRLPALLQSWASWERETVASFDLKPQINAILEQFPITEEQAMSWGAWRKQVLWEAETYHKLKEKDPKNVANVVPDFTKKYWGFKDDSKRKDSEMLTLKATPRYRFEAGLFGMGNIFDRLKAAKGTINKSQ